MPVLADFGTNLPSARALAQQAALLQMTYRHDQPAIEALTAPFGTVLYFRQSNETWPPDCAVVESGPGRYFVAVAGTTGNVQLALQSPALNLTVAQGSGGGYTGQLWYHAAQTLFFEIDPHLDMSDPGARIHLSGHSYGGVVAMLLAFKYARIYGPGRVELMTFGQPAGLTPGYTGEQPAVYWRVYSNLDPATFARLAQPGVVAVDLTRPSTWYDAAQQWTHYGTGVEIDAGGGIGGGRVDVIPRPPDVVVGGIGSHILPNYLGRIRQLLINAGSDPIGLDAIRAGFDSRARRPAERFRGGFGIEDLGLAQDIWSEAAQRLRFFNFNLFRGGSGMSEQKHTLIFTGPDSEIWTETYTCTANSDLDTALIQIPDAFFNARLALLHRAYKLRAIRAANITKPKGGAIRLLHLSGTAQGSASDPGIEPASVTAVYQLVASSGAKRRLWMRGWADNAIKRTEQGGDIGVRSQTSTELLWFQALADRNYGIVSRQKDDGGNTLQTRLVTKADGHVRPGQTLLYMSDTANLAAKDMVTLSLFNKKDLPGLNGIFEIKEVVAGTGIYVHYSTSDFRVVEEAPGRCRLIKTNPISTFVPTKCIATHYSSRKTKRNFTGSRGASRADRVRHLD